MRSAPSVPGVEVGASWLGGCEHALTAGALELLAVLHGTLGPGRAELPASRAVRDAERAGGTLPPFPAGTRDVRQGDWRMAPLAPGLVDSRVAITGPADRKMVINALNCGAKIFMADFEDSNTPTSGNLVTGQLNLRDASRRRYRRCSSDYAASKMPRERSATSSPPGSGRPRSR
jgi:malate synthase